MNYGWGIVALLMISSGVYGAWKNKALKQAAIEVLIVLGVVGAVAFIVTFNPWKHEQLPPIPMVELIPCPSASSR